MGENDFKVKTYKNSVFNKKITRILSIDNETGEVVTQSYRYGDEREED